MNTVITLINVGGHIFILSLFEGGGLIRGVIIRGRALIRERALIRVIAVFVVSGLQNTQKIL